MEDHDHDDLVEQFGLCTVCARATAAEQVAKAQAPTAAAYEAAPDKWKRKALAAVDSVCQLGQDFTTDDVWLLIPRVMEPRAMGGVMKEAERRGWCSPTGESRASAHPLGHGRLVRIWRPTTQVLFPGES